MSELPPLRSEKPVVQTDSAGATAKPEVVPPPVHGLVNDSTKLDARAGKVPPMSLFETDLGPYYRDPSEILDDERARVTRLMKEHPDKRDELLHDFQSRLVKQFNLPRPQDSKDFRFSTPILKQWQSELEQERDSNYAHFYNGFLLAAVKDRTAIDAALQSPEAFAHNLNVLAVEALQMALADRKE